MIKPEIIAGLKNALEHGFSIDEAKASFTNAGYSSIDVEDSVNAINSSQTQQAEITSQPTTLSPIAQANSTNSISAQKQITPQASSQIQQAAPNIVSTPLVQQTASPQPLSNFQLQVEEIEKSSSKRNIIILSIVLILLLSALTATIFFKDSVNQLLQNWF